VLNIKYVAKVIKYLQAKLAVPAFNEGFLERMGTCPNLSAKTKVFGAVIDMRPVLVDIINQRPCESNVTHLASFCHNTLSLASVCVLSLQFAGVLLGFTIAWCNTGGYPFGITLSMRPVCFRCKSCLFRLRFPFARVLPLLRDQLLLIGFKNMTGSIWLLVQVTGKYFKSKMATNYSLCWL
jgi:hypothetical protein